MVSKLINGTDPSGVSKLRTTEYTYPTSKPKMIGTTLTKESGFAIAFTRIMVTPVIAAAEALCHGMHLDMNM